MEINGRIEKIGAEPGVSKLSGKPYVRYVVGIGGKTYATFTEKVIEGFKAGDLVTVELEQNGKYMELVKITAMNEKISDSTVSEAIKGILVNRTENANSYEFGKAGNRFKLYFENVPDLLQKIEALKECGLYVEEFKEEIHVA